MKKTLFAALFLFLASPAHDASAARFSFEVPSGAQTREEFVVDLFVDTEGERANGFSGTVDLSPGVSLSRIIDGDSIVSLWIERPAEAEEDHIVFSGVTPGGFQGKGKLLSLVVSSAAAGNASFAVSDAIVTRHSEAGETLPISARGAYVPVRQGGEASAIMIDDSTPPEAFVPILAEDDELTEGGYFVSFSASDKGVGVEKYDWTSGFLWPDEDKWQAAESPLFIDSDSESKRIFIRAHDRAGNARIVSIAGPGYFDALLVRGILILLIVCVLFATRRYFSARPLS